MALKKSAPSKRQKSNKKRKGNKFIGWLRNNQRVVALLAILVFAGIGAWIITASKADSGDRGLTAYISTPEGCWLAGRNWNSSTGKCTQTCRNSGSNFIAASGDYLGYCSGYALKTLDASVCDARGRRFIHRVGCARKYVQQNDIGARQCRYVDNQYMAAGSSDYCASPCPTGGWAAYPGRPANCPQQVNTVSPTAINATDVNSVNTAYKNLWASGATVPAGWTGNASTCAAGNITQAAVNAQVNAVNFARQINGLGPVGSVALSDPTQIGVQQAAVMMEANGAVSHSPTTAWRCYTAAGASAASKSNLALSLPSITPLQAIKLYMDEPGANIGAGHRRWILNPPSSAFAFGMTNAASALQVIGLAQNNTANPAYTHWPSSGYFPNTLEPNGRWSTSSGNTNTSFASATVTVTHNGVGVPVTKNAVETGYARPTIVWQMPATFEKAGTYTVTIKNILVGSTAYSHTYSVTFFAPF